MIGFGLRFGGETRRVTVRQRKVAGYGSAMNGGAIRFVVDGSQLRFRGERRRVTVRWWKAGGYVSGVESGGLRSAVDGGAGREEQISNQ